MAAAARLGGVRGLVVVPVVVAVAGCGSLDAHQLPPPAAPARSPALRAVPAGQVLAGRLPAHDRWRARLPHGRVAVLDTRARVLELRAADGRVLATAGAGVGPAAVAADPDGRRVYVTDTAGGALLVFSLAPRFALVHRVYLPGAPYAVAAARGRLWVTLTARNELAELNLRRRPQLLCRLPTLRQPDAVAADAAGVTVAGAGRLQRIALTPRR